MPRPPVGPGALARGTDTPPLPPSPPSLPTCAAAAPPLSSLPHLLSPPAGATLAGAGSPLTLGHDSSSRLSSTLPLALPLPPLPLPPSPALLPSAAASPAASASPSGCGSSGSVAGAPLALTSSRLRGASSVARTGGCRGT